MNDLYWTCRVSGRGEMVVVVWESCMGKGEVEISSLKCLGKGLRLEPQVTVSVKIVYHSHY